MKPDGTQSSRPEADTEPTGFAALRPHRSFLWLWVARILGTSASQVLMLALAWQMYDRTGSAWDLGLVGLLQFLPALPLLLPAGHAIDRFHRSLILTLCFVGQVALAVTLAASTQWGTIDRTLLLAASVVVGCLRAFQMPTQQALTPSLVPAALLPRALAFSSSGMQAAIIVAPAAGGALYVAGAGVAYGVCTLLFAAAAVLVAWGVREPARAAPRGAGWDALMAGLRYVGSNRVVLGAISLDLFAVLLGGATALLPIFAKDILHVGPVGLGLLRGAPAVGALAMSLWLVRRPIRTRTGRTLLVAVAVYGVTMLVFAGSTNWLVSLAALAAGGAADMVSVVIRQTLVQLETPDEMRGRVSAVNAVFIGASNQLGEFESGATAAWFGPVGSVLLGGFGTIAVALAWVRLFPQLARRDRLV